MAIEAFGRMDKGALGTHLNAAYLISSIGSKRKEKRLHKIVLMSYKDGIKNASLTSREKHLVLNVFLQRAVFYLKEEHLGYSSFNCHFSKICLRVKAN